jgi:hypothetical protein
MERAAKSVNRLFNEPFEPLWMKRQREAKAVDEIQSLNDMLTRNSFNWKASAQESRERISERFKSSGQSVDVPI